VERKNNIFVFVGPPGCGKGTLSGLCVQELGWIQLSTGNLCRKHVAEGTEIGKRIDFILKSGKLIPDDLITEMVEGWLKQQEKSAIVILDGFPRTATQAESFHELMSTTLSSFELNVVRFGISEQAVIERLCSRIICANKNCQTVYSLSKDSLLLPKDLTTCDKCSTELVRRNDDDRAIAVERLATYRHHEQGMIDFYNKIGQYMHELNVEKPINDIFVDFKQLIEQPRT